MSDDRLKKLNEMRERNKKLQETLKLSGSTTTQLSNKPPTNTEERTQEILKKINATTSVPEQNLDELKRLAEKTKDSIQKYYMDQLREINVIDINFKPNASEYYDVKTQCNFQKEFADSESDEDLQSTIERKDSFSHSNFRKSVSFVQNNQGNKGKINLNAIKKVFDPILEETNKIEEIKPKVVNIEEVKKQLLNSEDLVSFVNKNSRYVERALSERTCIDLFESYLIEEKGDKPEKYSNIKKNLINKVLDFYDENLTYKRSVTSLEWSAKHPELLLAGYSKSEEGNLSDPHGLIALWSLGLRKKPEYILNSQTEITSAILHKFNPKLIIGATYTGQVLVWDTRGKNLPVMKTPPGGKYHSHPIYCLGITGSLNSNNIISVSNDGVLCTWSLPYLSKATKQINLKARKRKTQGGEYELGSNQYLEEVGAIVMATQESETNNVMLGTDDSDIYQVYTHQASTESPDNIIEVFRKHTGPITSIDLHPGDVYKNGNLNHLFLSCSMDWTFNLWSKNLDVPLMTFDLNDDYMYDVKWHPTHPALFSTADGSGKIDIWDLNKDYEVPTYTYEVSKEAINKTCWSQDGRRMAVAETNGKISILNFDKKVINHRNEDAFKLEKIVQMAKNSLKK